MPSQNPTTDPETDQPNDIGSVGVVVSSSAALLFVVSWLTFGPEMVGFIAALWFTSPVMISATFMGIVIQLRGGSWQRLSSTWKGCVLGTFLGAVWMPTYFLIHWIGDFDAYRTGSSTAAVSVFLLPLWNYPSMVVGGLIGALTGYALQRNRMEA